MTTFIGIDNGITGSIGIINDHGCFFRETPIKKEQNYTKAKQNISRIDIVKLNDLFQDYVFNLSQKMFCLVERPMVNPTRFKATTSALRSLEAVLIFLEINKVPFQYIDSKEWQRKILPSGVKGSDELKKASFDIGRRMFPQCNETIEKHKDADGILIAEYCRLKYGL